MDVLDLTNGIRSGLQAVSSGLHNDMALVKASTLCLVQSTHIRISAVGLFISCSPLSLVIYSLHFVKFLRREDGYDNGRENNNDIATP